MGEGEMDYDTLVGVISCLLNAEGGFPEERMQRVVPRIRGGVSCECSFKWPAPHGAGRGSCEAPWHQGDSSHCRIHLLELGSVRIYRVFKHLRDLRVSH